MVKRILTSALLLPLLLVIIYMRGVVLDISVALISIIALFEFYRGFENIGVRPMLKLSISTVILYYVGLYLSLPGVYYLFVTSFFTLALMLISLFGKSDNIKDVAITAFGFLYVVIPFIHIPLVSRLMSPNAFPFLLVYVFILAWVSDTCAYFIGKFFGKKKLLPSVSPNKTVAGSVAGIIGTAIVSTIYAYFIEPNFLLYAAPLGALGSIAGQVGDLIASKIKRHVNIKDYGKLIPGHGGILDRFDSIMLTAPIVYYIGYLYVNF